MDRLLWAGVMLAAVRPRLRLGGAGRPRSRPLAACSRTAAKMSSRPAPAPARGRAVDRMIWRTSATVRRGSCDSSSAAVPLTKGAAIEVPASEA